MQIVIFELSRESNCIYLSYAVIGGVVLVTGRIPQRVLLPNHSVERIESKSCLVRQPIHNRLSIANTIIDILRADIGFVVRLESRSVIFGNGLKPVQVIVLEAGHNSIRIFTRRPVADTVVGV
jgi:hypothetical protein